MNDRASLVVPPPARDRSTWLIVFGVLQAGLGVLCGLSSLAMLAGYVMTRGMGEAVPMGEGAPPSTMEHGLLLATVTVYLLAAIWFITMGIGSIRACRWARALTLVTASIALVCGVFATGFFVLLMQRVTAILPETEEMPPGFQEGMLFGLAIVALTVYVGAPGVLVLFYRGRNVKATCEYRHPRPSWTDACPLPVLAQMILLAIYAFSLAASGMMDWPVPFFGAYQRGEAGMTVIAVGAVAAASLALGAYKLRRWAWWGTLFFIVFWSVSAVLTFAQLDLFALYRAMDIPEAQLDVVRPLLASGSVNRFLIAGAAIWALGFLALIACNWRYYPNLRHSQAPS